MRLLQGVILILLYSCHTDQQGRVLTNRLEKRFENDVERKEFVARVVEFADQSRESREYYIGYDSKGRIVNEGNSEFYEYDSQGRIKKKYVCVLERDPECKHPYIFIYKYSGKKLVSIKRQNAFDSDSAIQVFETFEYDQYDRLAKHTERNNDTTVYFYSGNDTLKTSERWSTWSNNGDDKWVRTSRETTFIYDNGGKVTSSTWVQGDISMRNEFTYDKHARLVMRKDSSLSDFNREPNSCCVLYWTEMKYDDRSRLIEELHSTGSFDDPNPKFQWRKKYEYKENPQAPEGGIGNSVQ